MRIRLLTVYFSLCLALVGVSPAYGESVPWLYDVEVPVADQGAGARMDAATLALQQLLTRLTGLVEVPLEQPAVAEALRTPDRYYNGYRFVERDGIDERGDVIEELHLLVQFERNSVLRLLKAAQLPIWRSDRPRVVAWVAIEEAQGRRIVGAEDSSDLALGLTQRAQQRGVPLVLPLLDLADQLVVEPAAVWGRMQGVLQPASERYAADLLLLGRAQPLSGGLWNVGWELWMDDERLPLTRRGSQLLELGAEGADFVADELARRFAVVARDAAGISLAVRGIRRPEDYGGLLRYLNRLEFVDDVAVTQVVNDQVDLLVITRADITQLLNLFAVDRLLAEVVLDRPSRYDAELSWQNQ